MALNIVYSLFILVGAMVAINFRKALKINGLIVFIPYLLFVFLQEMSVLVYITLNPEQSSAVIYNLIYRPLSVCFFGFIYYRVPFNLFKNLIVVLTLIYLIWLFISFGFFNSIYTFNNQLYLGSGLIISIFAIFFLLSYFRVDNYERELQWIPYLWITIGISIYYPVVSISFSLYNYLHEYHTLLFGIKVYQLIPKIMSLFMYGCFVYAFYLCRKNKFT